MALKSVIKKLTDARAKYDAQLEKLGDKTAKEVAKEIGKLLPDGFALKWTQDTPSFNDGDPCTFSVHDPQLIRADEEEEEDDFEDEVDTEDGEESEDSDDDDEEEPDDDGETVEYPDEMDLSTVVDRYGKPDQKSKYGDWIDRGFPKIPGYTLKTLKELEKLWSSLPEDLLEAAFGDGAEVTIYPSGYYNNEEYYCE